MGINEMDFEWRLNWWYRPTQLDDFGTTVADYYDCFCDWKATMELNSCPANEADYVDAFIQNLKHEIRLRLESKGRPRTRRLSDAFYDAKFEESLISIEESFKKIEAKFEAHTSFLVVFAEYQENSSEEVVRTSCFPITSADSCSNELAENLSDDEFSCPKDYESSCSDGETSISEVLSVPIDSEKKTHKLFEELTEPDREEIPHPAHGDENVLVENELLPTGLQLPLLALITSCNDMSIEENGDDVKIISPIAACEVLDDLPHPFESSEQEITGLNSFPEVLNCISTNERVVYTSHNAIIQLMEKVDGLFLTKRHDMKFACKMLDEMPRLIFLKPREEIIVNMDSIALINCIPRVFDPGTSISLGMHNELFNKLLQPSVIATTDHAYTSKMFDINFDFMAERAEILREEMLDSGVCWPGDLRYEAGAPGDISTRISPNSKFELYEHFWAFEMSMLVFDPGGSWYLMRYHYFKTNDVTNVRTVFSIVGWQRLMEYADNTRKVGLTTLTKSILEEVFTLVATTIIHHAPMIVNQLVDSCSDLYDDDSWLSEIPTLIFDPGGGYWFCIGYDPVVSNCLKHSEILNYAELLHRVNELLNRQLMIAACSNKVAENRVDSGIGQGQIEAVILRCLWGYFQHYRYGYFIKPSASISMVSWLTVFPSNTPDGILLLFGAVKLCRKVLLDDDDRSCEVWLENFVWDPGQFSIFVYILEDKDVLRRKERMYYGG